MLRLLCGLFRLMFITAWAFGLRFMLPAKLLCSLLGKDWAVLGAIFDCSDSRLYFCFGPFLSGELFRITFLLAFELEVKLDFSGRIPDQWLFFELYSLVCCLISV